MVIEFVHRVVKATHLFVAQQLVCCGYTEASGRGGGRCVSVRTSVSVSVSASACVCARVGGRQRNALSLS